MDNDKSYIENKIINVLSEIEDATVIKADDFTEERSNNMIIVGISRITQMNYALPDYKYDLEVVVNTFIDEDQDGTLFTNTYKSVDRILSKWYLNEAPLDSLFESEDVVYFQPESTDLQLDQSSKANVAVLRFTIIASYE